MFHLHSLAPCEGRANSSDRFLTLVNTSGFWVFLLLAATFFDTRAAQRRRKQASVLEAPTKPSPGFSRSTISPPSATPRYILHSTYTRSNPTTLPPGSAPIGHAFHPRTFFHPFSITSGFPFATAARTFFGLLGAAYTDVSSAHSEEGKERTSRCSSSSIRRSIRSSEDSAASSAIAVDCRRSASAQGGETGRTIPESELRRTWRRGLTVAERAEPERARTSRRARALRRD